MKIILVIFIVVIPLIRSHVVRARDGPTNVTNKDKPAIRYGFQKTQACQVYEKAFVCIRKCLDLGYDIAHADKNCVCTCKHNRGLAKYKTPNIGPTRWKAGAPTTSLPAWVKKYTTTLSVTDQLPFLDDFEIYGDVPIPAKMNGVVTTPDQNSESLDVKNDSGTHSPNELENGTVITEKPDTNKLANDSKETNNETETVDLTAANNATVDPNAAHITTATLDPNAVNNSTATVNPNAVDNATTTVDPNAVNNAIATVDSNAVNNITAAVDPNAVDNIAATVDPNAVDNVTATVDSNNATAN